MIGGKRPMTDEERAVKAKYYREWRARNKDKVREYNRTYWQRRAARETSKEA